jgi:hypothetical protein
MRITGVPSLSEAGRVNACRPSSAEDVSVGRILSWRAEFTLVDIGSLLIVPGENAVISLAETDKSFHES